MKNLFSDIEDLALILAEKDSASIKTALEIVYLNGKLEAYEERIDNQNGKINEQISVMKQQIDALLLNFSNQTLGLVE